MYFLRRYGAHGVKDDIVKRLDAVNECRIRSYDKSGENINSVFMVYACVCVCICVRCT